MRIFSALLYYFVILPVSYLPFPLLYLLSDFLYLVLYRVLGFRKPVVMTNLVKSFPDKNPDEIRRIADLFYSHLCDVIVESLKSFTISEAEIMKRMVLLNPELPDAYFEKGQSVILAGGHFNNWEWIAVSIDQQVKHKSVAIYKQLTNEFFDQKMRETRGRFGLMMISTKRVKDFFEKFRGTPTATIFAIDQSPGKVEKSYWTRFLNQDTAVLFGTEKYAREYGYPVLFGYIDKVKRGYYTFRFVTVTDNPAATAHGEITEKVTRLLEEEILAAPQYWLWTHRRWKHKKRFTIDN